MVELVRRMRPLLGTFVEVQARGLHAERAIDDAWAAIEQAQRDWSVQDPSSELSRLNAQPGRRVRVSGRTRRLLQLARGLVRGSPGLFDITVGGHLTALGVLPDHGVQWLPRGHADDIDIGPDWVWLRRPVRLTLDGIAKGCELSGCALIGGETAEMPGMYPAGEYDLAGFCVGAVEKSKILTGQSVKPGDVVLGLASHGVHSNGFSLVRKCIERAAGNLPATLDGMPFKEAVMKPTRLYVKNVLAALAQHPIKALAHITGGGLLENIPRVLPEGTAAHLKKGSWPQTELFAWLQKTAGIDDIEMNRTFNNGIGMVVVIAAEEAAACAATLRELGETVYEIGAIAPKGDGASVVVA